MEFKELGVQQAIIKALEKQGISHPMPIQEAVYKPIIENRNLIAESKTGSGKTLAYLLPVFARLQPVQPGNQVLILVPTHELAMQVHRQIKLLAEYTGIAILGATAVGNVNITRQIEVLKKKPQIVIGTTGRILELIQKKKIAAHLIRTIIVDEADKMLSRSQIEETKMVFKRCMRDTQKLFFSASMNQDAVKLAKEIAIQAEVIRKSQNEKIPKNISHYYIVCENREKLDVLRGFITWLKAGKIMVFINKAYDIELAVKKLQHHHYNAACIHGSVRKQEREKAIRDFKNDKWDILVATDIAARGLHFEGVDAVIHYSIPEEARDYLHRAGRTGRNGKQGVSVCIVTKRELVYLKKYQKEYHIIMKECRLRNGKVSII